MQPQKLQVNLLEPSSPSVLPTIAGNNITLGDAVGNLFTLAIVIVICAAFMVMFKGAFKRMTATGAGDIAQSNTLITRSFLGIIGVLLIYPILSELNPSLTGSTLSFSTISLASQTDAAKDAENDTDTTAITPTGAVVPIPQSPSPAAQANLSSVQAFDIIKANETDSRNRLRSIGVGVNVGACTSIGQGGCTNVGGMSEGTFNLIKAMKEECACDIIVSGNTEWWLHGGQAADIQQNRSQHKPGGRGLDLKLSPPFDAYIKRVGAVAPRWSSGICVWGNFTLKGYQVCGEKDHWHIQ